MEPVVLDIANALNGKNYNAAQIVAACGFLATALMEQATEGKPEDRRRVTEGFIQTIRSAMNLPSASVTPLRVVPNTLN